MLTCMSTLIVFLVLISPVNFFAYSRTGRMEAKGCATPCVWKDARRRFYWSLRARLARSRILAQFTEANPNSSSDYRAQMLTQLAPPDATDMRKTAETLENLDISSTLAMLRSMRISEGLSKAAEVDRKATVSGLVEYARGLSDEERSTLLAALSGSS